MRIIKVGLYDERVATKTLLICIIDAQCRAAKPKEGIYRLNDYEGLYLEIKPDGVKAWRYRFKLNDKASWYALGDYPSVTLSEARERCEVARKLISEGINQVRHRQIGHIRREQDSANTFIIAEEWLAMKDWEEVTKKRRLDMLERVVFPLSESYLFARSLRLTCSRSLLRP